MESGSEVKTVIAEDVEIVGTIKCASNIEIKGKLDGDLSSGGKAVIGASAVVKGSLSVESTSILGQVNGNIVAKDRIEMKSSARVNGDIKSKRLTVEDGVTFIGKSEVNPSGVSADRSDSRKGGDAPAAENKGENKDENKDDKNKGAGMFGRK